MTSCSLTSYAMMSAASFSAAASAAILASSTALAVAVTCGVRPPPVSPSPAHSRAAARGQRRSSRVTRGTVCPASPPGGARFARPKHANALPGHPPGAHWFRHLPAPLAVGLDDLLEGLRRLAVRALACDLGGDGHDVQLVSPAATGLCVRPVPPVILRVPCPTMVSRQVLGSGVL